MLKLPPFSTPCCVLLTKPPKTTSFAVSDDRMAAVFGQRKVRAPWEHGAG